jgi:hypothetical protein
MRLNPILSVVLLALAASGANAAPTTASLPWNGSLFSPVNKIVGLWHAQVSVAPCNGGPVNTFLGINMFNAGGTLNDTNTFAPTSRGPGMGVWAYLGRAPDGSYRYRNHFQFARFLPDGSFDGLQDVSQEISLQADGNTWTSVVDGKVLNPDGSLRVAVCGSAIADRVGLD